MSGSVGKRIEKKKLKAKIRFDSLNTFMKMFGLDKKVFPRVIKIGDAYHSVSPELKNTMKGIEREPEYAGEIVGEDKKGKFIPSISLIEHVAKNTDYSDRKISLDKKSSWLFLCGRDIFKNSVKTEIERGHNIINNQHGENIGIAFFDGKTLINLKDKGDFLRREG